VRSPSATSQASQEQLAGDVVERIIHAVDGLESELVDAVSEAIRIPSINPRYPGQDYDDVVGGEGDVARYLVRLYDEIGCEADLFGIEPGRENCVGVLRGRGGGRSLIYNGHIDVVPPGPAEGWTDGDPWSGRVRDGKIWGRGACDMKAGVVAQAFALRALRTADVALRGDVILEAVVGEEMMEHELGTTACIERGYRADAAVVSEASAPPVPLAITPVTPGVMSFAVSVEGKATHTSMRGETIRAGGYGAEVGVNAIDKAFLVYEALRRLEDEWGLSKRHPLFRPGHFTIQAGVFVGAPRTGLVPFFIPDSTRIDYIVWYHPDDDPQSVREEIEQQVAAAAASDAWLRTHAPTVEWLHHWPASVVDPSHPIVNATCRAHERASGRPASINGFPAVSDATFLNQREIAAISYGPGDLRVAHANDEHVDIGELLLATRTYALLAADWCGT
jgi:acetylornithine deacetylase/succinyl-diaminopimelate desuccinylase family protein